MRHFLSQHAVSPLAHRVHPTASPASLVPLRRDALSASSRSPGALRIAVPSARDATAHRAQRERAVAPRIPTDDDVQRDHGPRRRDARHPRGPVRPRMGRTATSRSRGAIEGTEFQLRALAMCVEPIVPDVVAIGPRRVRRDDDGHRDCSVTRSRSVVLFAAIGGDQLRRDQQAHAGVRRDDGRAPKRVKARVGSSSLRS